MEEYAILKFGDKEIKLPVVTGTEGEKAIDITSLRSSTGLVIRNPIRKFFQSIKCSRSTIYNRINSVRYRFAHRPRTRPIKSGDCSFVCCYSCS